MWKKFKNLALNGKTCLLSKRESDKEAWARFDREVQSLRQNISVKMLNSWRNFNDVGEQILSLMIPDKTVAKVKMTIIKGGYIDEEWPDGYAQRIYGDPTTIYLACEFVVLGGRYDKRTICSNIELDKTDSIERTYIGRTVIKAILDSSKRLDPQDKSELAKSKRIIKDCGDLDGLEFVAEITINNTERIPRNEIKFIITPGHAKYNEYMTHTPKPGALTKESHDNKIQI